MSGWVKRCIHGWAFGEVRYRVRVINFAYGILLMVLTAAASVSFNSNVLHVSGKCSL